MENIEQIKKEREILQKEIVKMSKLIDKLTDALLLCRQQMLPINVGKVVDSVLKEIEEF